MEVEVRDVAGTGTGTGQVVTAAEPVMEGVTTEGVATNVVVMGIGVMEAEDTEDVVTVAVDENVVLPTGKSAYYVHCLWLDSG